MNLGYTGKISGECRLDVGYTGYTGSILGGYRFDVGGCSNDLGWISGESGLGEGGLSRLNDGWIRGDSRLNVGSPDGTHIGPPDKTEMGPL